MGLLDGGLSGAVSDLVDVEGQPGNSGGGRQGRHKTSSYEQVETTFSPGEKVPGLRRRISWGTEERYGYGMADRPRTIGTAFIELFDDAGNAVTDGQLHLVHNGPNKRSPTIVYSGDIGDLALEDVTNPSKDDREAIPEKVSYDPAEPEEHLEVWIEYEGDTSVTIDWDASKVKLPVTIYD